MRVLVCGSRDWSDPFLYTVLDGLNDGALELIEGGAPGADRMASSWVSTHGGVTHVSYPADWDRYGKGAGPIRNTRMLVEGKPELVVAFKDAFDESLARGGTENMVKQAIAAGVPVFHIRRVRSA